VEKGGLNGAEKTGRGVDQGVTPGSRVGKNQEKLKGTEKTPLTPLYMEKGSGGGSSGTSKTLPKTAN